MSWDLVKIEDVCEVGRGSSPRPIADQKFFEGGTIPWVKIADATASTRYIYKTKQYVNDYGASFSRKLKPGSIILAASGTLGFPMYLGVEACIHDGWLYFDNFDEEVIDKDFFYYYLQTLKPYFDQLSYGAAIQNVNTGILRNTDIPIPALKTQQRLSKIMRSYDDLMANNVNRIELLEELARITYEEWFIRFRFPGHEKTPINPETDLPEGWRTKKLGEIVKYIKRGVAPKYVEDKGVIVINQKCVREHRLDFSVARLTSKEKKISAEKFVQHGDVLVNSTGRGTLGRVAQYFGESKTCTVDTHVTIVRAKKEVISFYILGRFLEHIEPFIENLGKGATNQQELSASDMCAAIKMNFPPKDLQNKYEAFALPIFEEIKNLQAQNKLLKEARDILLPRLMTGMIDVADYNPSKLLQEAA